MLLFAMCVVSAILGSAFTVTVQHVQASAEETGVIEAQEFRMFGPDEGITL